MKEIDVSWAAREYQRSDESDGTTATAFEDGAEWMRKELTRWHDVRTEFPEFRQELLIKMKRKNGTTFHSIGWMVGQKIFVKHVRGAEIVAWRYIHE